MHFNILMKIDNNKPTNKNSIVFLYSARKDLLRPTQYKFITVYKEILKYDSSSIVFIK